MKPFADHFSCISASYAAYRPRYPARLFAVVAAAAPRRGLAWDCATGTGQAAVGLADHFDRVVATDASLGQLRQAEGRDRIGYAAGTAEASPLRSGTADVVTVAQALHWLELDRFYAEARRVLAPGGVLICWTYGRHGVDGGPIDAEMAYFYERVVGPYWPPERRWVEAGYAGLPFPFRETALQLPPMCEEWTLDQLLGYVSTWSATVRCAEATGSDPVPALQERLVPLWGGERSRRVEWKLSVRAGR